MRTLGSELKQYSGIGPGFDFLRLFLSTIIMFWHSRLYTSGPDTPHFLSGVIFSFVPVFFALSGFLVAGSMERTRNLRVFMTFRALRILPALTTEVCLSALILGPMVTTATMSDYFTDEKFYRYFGNIFGFVSFLLPGVFEHQPYPLVNGNLWTIPSEMLCYISLAALMLIGLAFQRSWMVAGFLGMTVIAFAYSFLEDSVTYSQVPRGLLLCFYAGNVLFQHRDRVPFRADLFLVAAIGLYGSALNSDRLFLIVGPACAAYLINYLGLLRMARVPFLMNGDYSYGIYLYGAPIQQSVIELTDNRLNWVANFVVAYPIAVCLAVASWKFVEKPALKLRSVLAPRAILSTKVQPASNTFTPT